MHRYQRSTRVADLIVNLTPAAADALENQKPVAVKASLGREHFADAIAVEIKLIDEVDARQETFGRRLIRLKLHKIRAHCRSLLMSD